MPNMRVYVGRRQHYYLCTIVHIDQIYLLILPINTLPFSIITFGCMHIIVYEDSSNISKQILENCIKTLSYLFETNSTKIPDGELLKKLQTELQWNGEKFTDLKLQSKYWKSLYLFYNLQRYNECNNYKNFALVPLFKHGMHHIRYDSFAFYNALCSLKLYSGPWKTFERDKQWRIHFKFPETANKCFNYSMQTDSVSVSFSMSKHSNAEPITTTTHKTKRKKYQTDEGNCLGDLLKIRSTKYTDRIGLDPGMRLIYGGIKNGQPIKLKNSKYQAMNGYHSRKMQLARYTSWFSEKSQESPHQADFTKYTAYRLSIFTIKQSTFAQRKVTRLKLKKFICVDKTIQKIAKTLVPDVSRKTLICVGSTEIAANSPIRGYVRTPHRKLIAALKSRAADVLFVNEFRTTKLCANCHYENITSKSPHRYQYCPNCRTCWNRDVNAGINILYLGECYINETQTHCNFVKKKTKCKL